MPKATPSNRVSSKVTLVFGIPVNGAEIPVQVPISLYTGTVSDHGVKRSRYVQTPNGDAEVGNQNYNKETGEVVAYSDIVLKMQTEYGPVYVEDAEIEKLFEITPDTVVVKHFQPLHLFHQGNYVPKGLNFVEPRVVGSGKKKGPDTNSVKILNSLFAAMRDKGACAVVDLTTRGVPKPAVLLPDGTLWMIHHTEEVREQRELPEYEATPQDVAMMTMAIDAKWSTDPLDIADERSVLIQAFADEKAAAGDFAKPAVEQRVETTVSETPDLMAMLAKSVADAEAARQAG